MLASNIITEIVEMKIARQIEEESQEHEKYEIVIRLLLMGMEITDVATITHVDAGSVDVIARGVSNSRMTAAEQLRLDGRNEEKRAIAKKMLLRGMSVEAVQQATVLVKEEIQMLM